MDLVLVGPQQQHLPQLLLLLLQRLLAHSRLVHGCSNVLYLLPVLHTYIKITFYIHANSRQEDEKI